MNTNSRSGKPGNFRRNNRNNNNKKNFSPNKNSGQSLRPQAQAGQPGDKNHKRSEASSNQNKKSGFFRNRHRNPNNNNNGNGNGPSNHGPQGLEATIGRKYEHFMEMYLNTRRKFFSVFFSDDSKQKDKSEKTYVAAAQSLRDFEKNLTDESKNALKSYLGEGKLDTTYSQLLASRGELEQWDEEAKQIPEMNDPHTLSTQKNKLFSGDTEVTEATPDDFGLFCKSKTK